MSRNLEIKKDYTNEQLIFKKTQDCSPILQANHLDRSLGLVKDKSYGRKVASVPIDVLEAWVKEGVDYRKINKDPDMRRKFFRRLNSPEFKFFKTYEGAIGNVN